MARFTFRGALRAVTALGGLALAACTSSGSSATDGPAPTVCNGHAELCARTYDHVAFPGTHDAYAIRAEKFVDADQSFPVAQQLTDGVRVLHLEVIPNLPDRDQALLCHGLCSLGSRPLLDTLKDVEDFITAHPTEVVTLLMESGAVSTDVLADTFTKSGLAPHLHEQKLGEPWPTLGRMIQHGDRVVVFHVDLTGAGGPTYPWMLDRWSFTGETPWNNVKVSDFGRCKVDRGTPGAPIYVVDTYLEDLQGQPPSHAALVNGNPFLLQRLLHCKSVTGALPNFVMVNFYEVGDVFHDVDVLNGFEPVPAGIPDAPPAAFDTTSDGGTDASDTGDAGSDAGPDAL